MADEDIRQKLVRKLQHNDLLRGARLEVRVEGGVVTLSGAVEGYARRWEAREAAFEIAGVREVVNRIKVLLCSASIAAKAS